MMSGETGFTSIADVLEAAARKSREDAAKLRARILSNGGRKARPGSSPASCGNGELLDDFDYAIDAVQMARKSLSHNRAGAEKAAVAILLARRRLSVQEATDLVRHAVRYLDE